MRRHPVLTFLAGGVLAVLAVVAVAAVAVWRSAHTDEARRVDHADVIVVLGAAQYAGRPSPVLEGRLEHAALLFRRGFAPDILVLGGSRPGDEHTEAEVAREWLLSDGLPAEAVHEEATGQTTLESLRAAAHYMHHQGMRSAFLVSDPWHNLRIRRMARDLGIEGFVSATWQSAARSRETRISGYGREVLAYLYYRLFRR